MGNIVNNIRAIRRVKGINQSEIAQSLGIDYSTYGKIERGQISLTVERLNQIAGIFSMTMDEIIHWGEENFEVKGVSAEMVDSLKNEIMILQDQIRDKNKIIKMMEDQIKKTYDQSFLALI